MTLRFTVALIAGFIWAVSAAEVALAHSIFCFISFSDEVDTHNLIRELQQQNKIIIVPKILPIRKMAAVLLPAWQELETDSFGILVPRSSQPCSQCPLGHRQPQGSRSLPLVAARSHSRGSRMPPGSLPLESAVPATDAHPSGHEVHTRWRVGRHEVHSRSWVGGTNCSFDRVRGGVLR